MTAGRDAATLDQGPPAMDGPCGRPGGTCCGGRICELGLACGRGDRCVIEAGSPLPCERTGQCAVGLTCERPDDETPGRCCAPARSTCAASSDCCTGLACDADGVCSPPADVDPDNPGCGGPGAVCCAGFTCLDEGVCRDGRCTGCGQEGEPCCDGASPCTSRSLSCEVSEGPGGEPVATCVDPLDPSRRCGGIDEPCCDDESDGGGCEGDLTCGPSDLCLRPDDRGAEGERCRSRDGCDSGLLCDRRDDPDGVCADTPDGCGRDGQMCCDLGGSSALCEGALSCQFGECDTCRGPSLTCLLGSLLPGEECCGGSSCRPAPLIPRCCMGQGARCSGSLDCCGLMQCRDGTCQCGARNTFCLDSAECCDGLVCDNFLCRAGTDTMDPMCTGRGTSCETNAGCCGALVCSETRSEPTAPAVRQCCSVADTACESGDDCCGRMACDDGECVCVDRGGLCDRDVECCDEDICVAGGCADGEGCARETETCTDDGSSAPRCCGGLRCDVPVTDRERRCCAGVDNRCRSDDDCCGASTCENETCVCVPEGSTCETGLECCAGLSCLETAPDSGAFTCRRPGDE